jgi:Skp family chaperone for outer membrane proteins
MRTFFCLSLLFIFSLFVAGCKNEANPKLAVVDPEIVFAKSTLSEKGNAYLQSLLSDLQAEFEELQKKIDAAPDDEKQMIEADMQIKLLEMQQQLNIVQEHINVIISESFDKALEAYRVRNGYDIILYSAAVLASGINIDVTMPVLDELNAMTAAIDFSLPPD